MKARFFNGVSLVALDFEGASVHFGVRPRDWQFRRHWDGWLEGFGFGPFFAVWRP